MKESKRVIVGLVVLIMIVSVMILTSRSTAKADEQEPCVPRDAWVETIEHPEVSHFEDRVVVDEPAWVETVPAQAAVWANFSPNDNRAPFNGPPTWPTDARGTWSIRGDLPGGHVGPDGVYQQGSGHGSWFYRKAAVAETIINHPAVTHIESVKIVDVEARTETIYHDAVTCSPETGEVTPVYDVSIQCPAHVVTAPDTDDYTVERTTMPRHSSRIVELTFTIREGVNKGFVGEQFVISDDGRIASIRIFLPVLRRCAAPNPDPDVPWTPKPVPDENKPTKPKPTKPKPSPVPVTEISHVYECGKVTHLTVTRQGGKIVSRKVVVETNDACDPRSPGSKNWTPSEEGL